MLSVEKKFDNPVLRISHRQYSYGSWGKRKQIFSYQTIINQQYPFFFTINDNFANQCTAHPTYTQIAKIALRSYLWTRNLIFDNLVLSNRLTHHHHRYFLITLQQMIKRFQSKGGWAIRGRELTLLLLYLFMLL